MYTLERTISASMCVFNMSSLTCEVMDIAAIVVDKRHSSTTTSLRLLIGFKHSIPVTPDSYTFMLPKLPKQKIGVKATSPPRNVEDSDELSAGCIDATKSWIENNLVAKIFQV